MSNLCTSKPCRYYYRFGPLFQFLLEFSLFQKGRIRRHDIFRSPRSSELQLFSLSYTLEAEPMDCCSNLDTGTLDPQTSLDEYFLWLTDAVLLAVLCFCLCYLTFLAFWAYLMFPRISVSETTKTTYEDLEKSLPTPVNQNASKDLLVQTILQFYPDLSRELVDGDRELLSIHLSENNLALWLFNTKRRRMLYGGIVANDHPLD
jgi:hypothetical protein